MVTLSAKVLAGILGSILLILGMYTQLPKSLQVPQTFGALTGPDIPSQYLNWGGVPIWHFSMQMTQGTSTPCSFTSPAASSTLTSATTQFTGAIGYTTGWLWGTDRTNPTATTTALGTMLSVLSPDITGAIVASTTAGTVYPGGTRLNFNLSTSTAGVNANFAPVGRCYAEFKEV